MARRLIRILMAGRWQPGNRSSSLVNDSSSQILTRAVVDLERPGAAGGGSRQRQVQARRRTYIRTRALNAHLRTVRLWLTLSHSFSPRSYCNYNSESNLNSNLHSLLLILNTDIYSHSQLTPSLNFTLVLSLNLSRACARVYVHSRAYRKREAGR